MALENPPSSLTCAPRGCVAQRGRGGSDGCPPLAGLGKEEAMENAGARGGLGLGVLGGARGGQKAEQTERNEIKRIKVAAGGRRGGG